MIAARGMLTMPRRLAALVAAGCVALSLMMAGGAATGSVTGSGSARPMPRPGSARLAPVDLARMRITGARAQAAQEPAAGPGRTAFAVPGGPIVLASNPRTRTLYAVTISRTIALVGTAHCNRMDRSGCQVIASVPGQAGFAYVVVDPATDTIYALFGGSAGDGHTVQVINGARCNAANASGCRPVATVQVGKFPIGAALDRASHTLYVSNNYSNTVSMINTATCNATRTTGCAGQIPAARAGKGPNLSAVDPATHTLYVPNNGPGGSGGNTGSNGTTVSLINTATCNATRQDGCRVPAPAAAVGHTPFGVTIAAGTVYAWNNTGSAGRPFSNQASLINAATCNATRQTSCAQVKPTATVGVGPGPGASNPRTHSVYAVNADDDTVSVLDSATCNARHPAGCSPVPPTLATGAGAAYVLPDPATGTLYVANVVDSTVSVLSGAACNATNTSGCRRLAPTVPQSEFLLSADPATNTIYAGNISLPQIDVINGATCHAGNVSGCAPVAQIPMPDSQANVGAIDAATHTLYAADESPSGTVAVINTAACNAQHTSGCAQHPPMIKVGPFPGSPVLNPVTHTAYAPYGNNGGKVAVINAATCNATDTSGCGQAPAVAKVGPGTFSLAVSPATNTVYGPNFGSAANGFTSDTVSVINGATCNATDSSGCGHLAATVKVGLNPIGVAVNDRTHTVYTTNLASGDSPGTVSVINGATCNGTITTGCHRRFPTMPTGRSPFQITLDPRAGVLYVTNFSAASVTVLNGARCNAAITSGCGRAGRQQAVGSLPEGIAVNPRNRTVYATNTFLPGSLSVFKASGGGA